MELIRVQVRELSETVSKNREAHRAVFLEAQEKYRELMIAELDTMIEDARSGRKIRRAISMPEPEDHTGDYDRVLRMLEMSVDEVIELSEHDFSRYVMDQWEWERSFHSNTMAYLTKA